MKCPQLSICVPTYNRAGLLRQMLDEAGSQLNERLAEQIEFVISDNASPDNTQEVIEQFIADHPRVGVRSLRQESNVGADANIYNAFRHATGDFVLLFSDDDLFLPQAIQTAITILETHPNLNAVALNTRSFATSPSEPCAPLFHLTSDRTITDPDAAVQFLGTMLTFLSVILFRRALVADRNYADRIGTSLLQSYIFVDVLARPGGLYVTQEPYIGIRNNNTGGYSFFEVFVTNFAALMKHAERIGLGRAAVRRVLADHRRWLLVFIMGFKVRGSFGQLKPDYRDGRRRLIHAYGSDPFLLLVILPTMLCPGALARMVHRLSRLHKALSKPKVGPDNRIANGRSNG